MREILVVTQNKGKLREILEIYKDLPVTLKTLNDFPQINIKEDGNSFLENAYIKAKTASKAFNITTMGEDSGLCVPVLGNIPGIYSRRFAGEEATDEENNKLLLEKLKSVPFEERKAYFVSTVVVLKPSGEFISAEGRVSGYIAFEPKGDNGFGYDPIFYLPEYKATFAELPLDFKNRISHRKKALEKLKEEIYGFLSND